LPRWREFTFTAPDGLLLFGREFGPAESDLTPLLCLAGLTRNSSDFEPLADSLDPNRRLVAFDYRGRGRSHWSPDPRTYTPHHELADAIALLDHLGLSRVAVVGTSRGGIIAMLMAALCGQRMAGAVLNDIGPRLETDGLLRIATLVSSAPSFATWAEAVASLQLANPGIVGLPQADWQKFAKRIFKQDGDRFIADYDPRLRENFPTVEVVKAGKIPELWEPFGALRDKPCAVLRGENSDLLSPATVERMSAMHPGLIGVTVRNRGHVPFLDEPESLEAITAVAAACDREKSGRGA
jgi:pimeloyl-ACP methyl ester carboxylesterase